jgi:hypothetical protein
MHTMTAKPTLPKLDDDLYSDKRPLHDDYYDYPSNDMAYPMSEPATPYQHHHHHPPMPQRAYTQPTPYSGYHHEGPNTINQQNDYFDSASYYSSPQPSHQQQPSPMSRYNTLGKYDMTTPSSPATGSYFGTPKSKPSTVSSPFTPYSDTPTMVASPAPYSAQVAASPSIPQATPRYQQHTAPSPYSQQQNIRSPQQPQHEYYHQHTF